MGWDAESIPPLPPPPLLDPSVPDSPEPDGQAPTSQASPANGPAEYELGPLLARHLPGLHTYVRLNLGALLRSREAVSDVVQSAVREVLKNAPEFEWRGEAAFRSFLCAVAANKILEKRRHHLAQRRDARRTEPEPADDATGVDGRKTTEQIAELDALEQAFGQLEDEERRILSMAFVFEVPTEEIAESLGIPLRTAQWRLAQARARLAWLFSRGQGA